MTPHSVCPFCEGHRLGAFHYGHLDKPWTVECYVCGARGPYASTEEAAWRAWDARGNE